MLRVDRICKRFGAVHAVKDVSFAVQPGEVTGLLGPNGAGKTSILRIITGLVRPDAGRVQLCGLDVRESPEKARALLGVLPDSRGLYPRLTAEEHLTYAGRLYGVAESLLRDRVTDLASQLDMGALMGRRVAGFSQGERMKVALARALVHDPRCVLLDEPTNGLDVTSTRAVRGLIRQLRERGKMVLLSSHVMGEVAALCDQLVVVVNGEVARMGTPTTLMEATGATSLEEAFMACLEAS